MKRGYSEADAVRDGKALYIKKDDFGVHEDGTPAEGIWYITDGVYSWCYYRTLRDAQGVVHSAGQKTAYFG